MDNFKKEELIDILCSLGMSIGESEEKIKDYEDFIKDIKEYQGAKIEPNYYHKGKVDTIKFCQENGLDFLQGNIIKYTVRYKDKNGLEDLYKARTYLDRLIEFEEGNKC